MSRKQRNASRRAPRNRSAQMWKPVMAILIIITAVLIILAWRSARSESRPAAPDGVATTPTSIPLRPAHYPDLEIARAATGAPDSTRRVDYEGFSLAFNPANHTADWVGWELLGAETDGDVGRSNQFWADPNVEGSATPDDYRRSGFDKGHLCPSADQKWSPQAMTDCFVMTNITPQRHALNNGAWKTLENKERLWARRDSAIVIVAGPIYAPTDTLHIGQTRVRVPSAFYKVLLAPYVEQPRAIGFVYPNMTAPGNMADYAMSVDEVENLTGLDFFSSLPDDLEQQVEKSASFNTWNK